MPSLTEENYLKAIYRLLETEPDGVTTSALAGALKVKPATATDMISRLARARYVKHEKYHGVVLTEKGEKAALEIIRRHRLWEVFLAEKLQFSWDEVHEMAEQLEHVQSAELTDRLDKFLGHPKTDPHGDPIPDKQGRMVAKSLITLAVMKPGGEGIISGVTEHSPAFLQYLEKNRLQLGNHICLAEVHEFDRSVEVRINSKHNLHLSHEVARHILVKLHGKQ